MRVRIPLLLVWIVLLVSIPARRADARQEEPSMSRSERASVVDDVRDIALEVRRLADRADRSRTERDLDRVADRMSRAADDFEAGGPVRSTRDRLLDAVERMTEVEDELDDRDRDELQRRVESLINRIDRLVDRLDDRIGEDRDEGWWFWSDRNDPETRARRKEVRERWRSTRNRIRRHAPSYVGELSDDWPYRETGPYRPTPAIRYNRVDGLVLGVRRMPLDWNSYDRARVYGQVGYAFALEDWRYEIGGEARLGRPYREENMDLKIGAAYRRDTGTDDLWKVSQVENSLAAFFVKEDYYDYFETEGFTAYGIVRLSPAAQVSVAYRSEDYTSLARNTSWSLFGGDGFRTNPGIWDGRMQSITVAVDGGRIRGYRAVPQGVAYRLTAEVGRGLEGDFDFNRYIGDVHSYLRTGPSSGLAVRLRAGTSTGDLPPQRRFTLGGIGTVRAYPQNIIGGSEMGLFNAEYSIYGHDLFDDVFEDIVFFGLFDAGWTNGPADAEFDWDDVLPAAGFGAGFGDRTLRLELAFPLRDRGFGMEPTLWLRFSPTI